MTPSQFRRIALGLPNVMEASHMSHPDFRAANGRIFASLTEDETRATTTLTPDQQAEFLSRAPETFVAAAGAWGRGGWTMINLKGADAEMVGEAVTLAWQRIVTLPASKSKARKKAKTVKTASKPKKAAKKR
jgi:hypothetical protein